MNGIGLNETQLSRISHHWFWGLYKAPTAGVSTLYDMAIDLEQHPQKKEHIALLLKRVGLSISSGIAALAAKNVNIDKA